MLNLKKWLLGLVAIHVLISPGLVQIAGIDIPEIRGWQMYGGVGLGAPFGHFTVQAKSGQQSQTTPLIMAMGYQRTSELQAYPGSGRLKRDRFSSNDIVLLGRTLCESLEPGESLSFKGRIAQPRGWEDLELDHDQLCFAEREQSK